MLRCKDLSAGEGWKVEFAETYKTKIEMKHYFLLLLLTVMIGCSSQTELDYVINSGKDTIKIDEIHSTEICFSDKKSIRNPRIYIIYKNDTTYLPVDSVKNCFVYNGLGVREGLTKWNAIIEYNKDDKAIKHEFSRGYYVSSP